MDTLAGWRSTTFARSGWTGHDVTAMIDFWPAALGYELDHRGSGYTVLRDPAGAEPRLFLQLACDDAVGSVAATPARGFNGSMLASLLPGLRDLRAPLATGYIWLVVAWLAVGRHLHGSAASSGFVGDVQGLAQYAGRPAVGIAVTFVAYLVGILSVAVSQKLLQILAGSVIRISREGYEEYSQSDTSFRAWDREWSSSWRLLPFGWSMSAQRISGVWPSRASLAMLADAFEDASVSVASDKTETDKDPAADNFEDASVSVASDKTETDKDPAADNFGKLVADLNLVPSRLLGRDPDLYGAYDRKRSEAEFRGAVSLPLLAVCFTLAFEINWFWLLLLPVPIILIRQAMGLQRAASDVLAEAVRSGRVESPVLQRLRQGKVYNSKSP
jgi:hypothetical protein